MINLILPDWMLTDSCGRYYLIHEHTRQQTEKHKADVRAMNEYKRTHPWNVAYPESAADRMREKEEFEHRDFWNKGGGM